MKFSADELRTVGILNGLSDAELAWFAEHGDRVQLSPGDHMFERGQPADFMFIVVTGAIEGYEDVSGQELLVATTRSGEVTGMLPFSRMTHYPRYTVAAEASTVLRVRKDDFPAMLEISLDVGQRLVAVMSERVRGDVRLRQQHEKMVALGRLSAGLAHELNNPAAAIGRAAEALTEELAGLQGLVGGLVRHDVNGSHVEAMTNLQRLPEERTDEEVSALMRSRSEDELATWFEEHDVPKAWEIAGTFADAGLTVDDLAAFAGKVPQPLLTDALVWVSCGIGAQRIIGDIASAAARISELVASVKIYSHMDRSPEHKPTDVRVGLDNTLTLLRHKLVSRNIRIARTYQADLPLIPGNAGELNQVWTNLLDNAIDAVDDGGEVRIEAHADESHVSVCIIDNGHGIPEDTVDRIFEPFFTTKSVGEGTGLGLDIALRIVRTHKGDIVVESRPQHTMMRVRLPAGFPAPQRGAARQAEAAAGQASPGESPEK